jgi:hypothetical protein
MKQVPANAGPGLAGDLLVSDVNVFGCPLDYGPISTLPNQIIYYEPFLEAFYRVAPGAGDGGTKVLDAPADPGGLVDAVEWLPDGSGFVFSQYDIFLSEGNLYRYDFATQEVTPLTNFESEFAAGDLAISPDGQYIVFERFTELTGGSDLWIMGSDGSGMQLLIADAARPSWAPTAVTQPPTLDIHLYLPGVTR